MKYLVQYSVNYSLYVEADDEYDACERAGATAEWRWGRSVSQWDASEVSDGPESQPVAKKGEHTK